jgi:flavin-dependent dehydrogenase
MPALQPVPVEGSALVETCDVCVVGAGLAGLNALFVASQYLSRDQKVILVDRRRRVGGAGITAKGGGGTVSLFHWLG